MAGRPSRADLPHMHMAQDDQPTIVLLRFLNVLSMDDVWDLLRDVEMSGVPLSSHQPMLIDLILS